MKEYENELYNQGIELIAGVDEVGRGPLVGPVVCACVILPKDYYNDTKIARSHETAKPHCYFSRFSVTTTISLGTQKRTFRLDVPTPLVVMTVLPSVVLFLPRRNLAP